MPRRPTKKHPIRDLRRVIGKTQRGFAESIGVSPTWLKQIENRVRDLSPRTARAIRFEAGVDDRELLRGKLRGAFGEKYTAASYDEWKKRFTTQDETTARKFAEDIACWTFVLLRASAVGSKRRLWQVSESLIDALDGARTAFKLGRATDEILSRYGGKDREGRAWRPEWYPQGRDAPAELRRELFIDRKQ
jgi:transcriptional regulator with XRE-family HTH domain